MLDRSAISDVVLRFAHSLDIKDWELCRSCFADTIEADYSDLRGEPPAAISADDFVEKRRTALAQLRTLHQSTNHLISIDGDRAVCISNAVIYRWRPGADGEAFHTYAIYTHHLQRTDAGWKIDRVKQAVVWNTGDAGIHRGASG